MKIKVLEKFRDVKTGEIYQPGRILEVDDARGKKIVAAKLGAALDKPKKSDKKDETRE